MNPSHYCFHEAVHINSNDSDNDDCSVMETGDDQVKEFGFESNENFGDTNTDRIIKDLAI